MPACDRFEVQRPGRLACLRARIVSVLKAPEKMLRLLQGCHCREVVVLDYLFAREQRQHLRGIVHLQFWSAADEEFPIRETYF